MTVGRPIRAGEAISRSAKILATRPLIMLPQTMLLIPTLIAVFGASSGLSPLTAIVFLVSAVLSAIINGAYPSMVKAVIEGGPLSVTEALGKASRRFWALLAAGILVALIVALGIIALLVPGIILFTWYAYTVPALMLEDKGALEGMAASKAFGRNKKGDTFLILLALGMAGLVVLAVQFIVSQASAPLGQLVYAILSVPLGAWASVIFSYTYLTYGPSRAPATPETAGYALAPPAPPRPAQANAPTETQGSFCRFCGSRVGTGSKFCASCGKLLW